MNENRVYEDKHHWLMHGHPGHTIAVPRDGRWTFDGDYVKPTFKPSINETGGHHFFVKEGVVRYLPDGVCNCGSAEEFWTIPPWEDD